MGADIKFTNKHMEGGEEIGDIIVKSSKLSGVEIPAARAASMIDEYPILAVAAAFATGKTIMRGIGELRVKECDRLKAIVDGLRANGVTVEDGDDWIIIHGNSGNVKGGGLVKTHLDHRIAMSFLIMGLATKNAVEIDDASPIKTSFPNFQQIMNDLGAEFSN